MSKTMIIDGRKVPFTDEKNVLGVIRNAGISLPTFCYHSELSIYGACRMCSVEDKRGNIIASCSERPKDGMEVKTNTQRLQKYRKTILELLLSNHDKDCTTCEITGKCDLQELAARYGVKRVRFENNMEESEIDNSSPSLVRNPNKCIKCGDCVMVCEDVQGVGALGFAHRGSEVKITPAFDRSLAQSNCVNCGQCRIVCPTGAITIKNDTQKVWDYLFDEKVKVAVQIAPAVRVALGEEFGMKAGTATIGKMISALRKIGFDEIYDTAIAADITVKEETKEFLQKMAEGKDLPLFTSCCPAWVKFVENKYPEYIHNLSSAKSPQQIFGSVYKAYAEKEKSESEDKRESILVSIMPCTAKKEEITRPQFQKDGKRDVDVVLTTQELAIMIKEMGISLQDQDDESFDMPFGATSGAGIIFGNTGGVTEAVLRDVVLEKTGKHIVLEDLFQDVRGLEEVKEATVTLGDREIRIAVVHGLKNADMVLKEMKEGKRQYDLVEVMACRGGCISGGGQPVNRTPAMETRKDRAAGLYGIDKKKQFKRAKDNYVMNSLYEGILKDNEHIMHIHR